MAPSSKSPAGSGGKKERPALPMDVSIGGIVLLASMIVFYTAHCVWVSAEMYSAPSIVLQSRNRDGSVKSFDDFREAYAWLRCVLFIVLLGVPPFISFSGVKKGMAPERIVFIVCDVLLSRVVLTPVQFTCPVMHAGMHIGFIFAASSTTTCGKPANCFSRWT